jgi:DNA-directed RNA polymerase specialized sigma24 family protein
MFYGLIVQSGTPDQAGASWPRLAGVGKHSDIWDNAQVRALLGSAPMDRGTTVLKSHDLSIDALTAAYDLYAVALYDYCSRALGDNRLAEDAVHDALLAAAGRGVLPADPAGADPVQAEALRAWVFAAARNETVRRAQPDRPPSQELAPYRPSRDERVRLAQLRNALGQLSPEDREIAELTFRHGFGCAALAALLGRPQASVRRSVARIYAYLAAQCDDRVAATFSVAPFQGPPIPLRTRVIATAAAPEALVQVATQQAAYDRAGFPRPADRKRGRAAVLAGSGAGAAVLLAVAVIADATFTGGGLRGHAGLADDTPRPTFGAPVFADPVVPPSASIPPSAASQNVRAVGTVPSASAPAARPAVPKTPPRTVTSPRPAISAQLAFSVEATTRIWSVTVLAPVTGMEPTSVRIAVWWRDTDGSHRRDATAKRAGSHTYRVRISGLRYGPVACAQARAITASGGTVTSPIASPGGFGYCGSSRLGRAATAKRTPR